MFFSDDQEMSGNVRMSGKVGKSREMSGNVGKCREMTTNGQEKGQERSGNDVLPAHMIFKNHSCLQNFLSFISNLAI